MHWGWEREEQPSERQRQLARTMIDAGADVVVGGHPHVTQGAEYYRGKLIVYSLGNFVFDGFDNAATRTGWLLRLTLDKSGLMAWETLAAHMDDDGSPQPRAGVATPCGRAGDSVVGECVNLPGGCAADRRFAAAGTTRRITAVSVPGSGRHLGRRDQRRLSCGACNARFAGLRRTGGILGPPALDRRSTGSPSRPGCVSTVGRRPSACRAMCAPMGRSWTTCPWRGCCAKASRRRASKRPCDREPSMPWRSARPVIPAAFTGPFCQTANRDAFQAWTRPGRRGEFQTDDGRALDGFQCDPVPVPVDPRCWSTGGRSSLAMGRCVKSHRCHRRCTWAQRKSW
jgi:hypothetical protein